MIYKLGRYSSGPAFAAALTPFLLNLSSYCKWDLRRLLWIAGSPYSTLSALSDLSPGGGWTPLNPWAWINRTVAVYKRFSPLYTIDLENLSGPQKKILYYDSNASSEWPK